MKNNTKHTFLFRVVSTFIFLLLLLQNVAVSYPRNQGFVGRFLRAMYTMFFNTQTASYPVITKTRTYTTLADSCRNPVCPPPPPKPSGPATGP